MHLLAFHLMELIYKVNYIADYTNLLTMLGI